MSFQAPQDLPGETARLMTDYRQVREKVERSILPLATSIDGKSFGFQASLYDLHLRRGGYVMLEDGGEPRLGQVTDLEMVVEDASDAGGQAAGRLRLRLATGTGRVLEGDERPCHDARVRPATAGEVGAWRARVRTGRAGLEIGELLMAPGVPAVLDSGGFDRHTFLCGQSGSGKTYSLGLLLERLLAETTLRVVILDPNSDYVGLPRLREGADPELAARYSRVPSEVAVWRNGPGGSHPLKLRFADLDGATQAAVLDLHPIRDRDEYAALNDLLGARVEGKPLITGAEQLLHAETPGARALGLRAANLGVFDWTVWGPEDRSLVEDLRAPSARCTVVDLGSLDTLQEQRLVARAVLSTLWESKASRVPCLVVVDEAHNICPADPPDRLSTLATDVAVQIAAEGRKYGLYLLTSTQRPNKVHENVVSQCDNLVLMRMNSQADLADLSRTFSFVPEGLMRGATSFRMGEALVAGKVLPQAAYVRMGQRVSEEGGADVPTTWATPRERPS
jgi:hypothetical protein